MAESFSRITADHDEIKSWVKRHGGKPVRVKGTGLKDDTGVLRIEFQGAKGEQSFELVSWDEWFEKFDQNNLALRYQQRKRDGSDSTSFKLVRR